MQKWPSPKWRIASQSLVGFVLAAATTFTDLRASAEELPHSTPSRNPAFTPPDRSLYEDGRYVYERNCVVCHGANGDGHGEMAASMGIKPRSFRTGLFKYRSTPWGKLPTTEDLVRTVREGRTGTAMGMFTHLREDDLRAVVEYVKSFSRQWRKPENYAQPVALPREPDWLADSVRRQSHVGAGKLTFKAICASCHGPDGDGKGPAATMLKDDAGEPAQPADLRQPHLRSGDEPIDIYRVLATGLNGTPMVSFEDSLTQDQKWDLVAYVLMLREDSAEADESRRP